MSGKVLRKMMTSVYIQIVIDRTPSEYPSSAKGVQIIQGQNTYPTS